MKATKGQRGLSRPGVGVAGYAKGVLEEIETAFRIGGVWWQSTNLLISGDWQGFVREDLSLPVVVASTRISAPSLSEPGRTCSSC